MQEKSVGKNYIYNLIYQLLVFAIPLVTTPYVGRVLGADGVGAFSYTTAMTGYFALFGNLGVATYGQLKIAGTRGNKREMSRIFYELVILRLILMSIVLLLYFAFVFGLSQRENRSLYLVLAMYIGAAMFDVAWFFQGLEEFKKIVLRNILIKLASLILIFGFVKEARDIYLYAFIMNGSTFLGNMSIWLFVPDLVEKVPLKSLKPFSHLRKCVVYFIPTIATTIYLTLDKTMIGWFTTTNIENGYYEQAHKIEQMAVTVVTSLSIVTMPRMAYLYKNNEIEKLHDRLERTLKFIMMIAIPMCLGIIAVSDYFIPLYLGEAFAPSIVLMKIFSVLLVVVGLNNAVGKQILMAMGRQKSYNVAVIAGAVSNFFLNLVLIPKYYSVGAAIASVAAETVILSIFVYHSRDMITGKWIVCNSVKYVVSGLVMFCCVRASYSFLTKSWLAVVVQVILGITIYFAMTIILRDSLVLDGKKKAATYLKNHCR